MADGIGMEVPEYSNTGALLAELMKGKDDVWDQIVKQYKLELVTLATRGFGFDSALGSGEREHHVRE